MARGYGSAAMFALKRGASGQAWGSGTVPTLASNDRYPFKSTSLDVLRDNVPDDSITGQAERAVPQYTNKRAAGQVVAIMDPRQLPAILSAMVLGTAGAPTALSGSDTGAYEHLLKWGAQSTQEGLWCSAGVNYGADTVQYQYLKAGRRLISGRTGGYLETAFDLMGRGEDRGASSASWTFRNSPVGTGARVLLMRQTVIRLNAQAGGALGSTDTVYPVSFELEATRQNAEDYAQAGESEEPLPGDFADITLRLAFRQLSSELVALFRDIRNGDGLLKASIIATGDDLIIGGGAQKFAWKCYLPMLKVIEDPTSVDGPGPVPYRVVATAHAAPSTPTGFTTGYTSALNELWYNALSSDLLA